MIKLVESSRGLIQEMTEVARKIAEEENAVSLYELRVIGCQLRILRYLDQLEQLNNELKAVQDCLGGV